MLSRSLRVSESSLGNNVGIWESEEGELMERRVRTTPRGLAVEGNEMWTERSLSVLSLSLRLAPACSRLLLRCLRQTNSRPDGTRELVHPGGVDGAEQRGIDDEASERIDESHVRRGDAADGSHVDRPVEAVAGGLLHERVGRNGVNRRVPDLARRLARECVQGAKGSVGGAGRHERSLPIRLRESVVEDRRRVGVLAHTLPPEGPSDRAPQ